LTEPRAASRSLGMRPAREAGNAGAPGTDLVARLKQGDERAFEELVRAQGPRMLAVIRRFLPQEADAQDALQDAFVSVTRAISGFDGASLLSTWLHRVAVNAALMRIRSRSRRAEVTADEGTLDAALDERAPASWSRTASELLSRAELRQIVREEIARLPDAYRIVLVLREVEGLELLEVASLVGIGLTTLKARLHRARQALRAALGPRLAASEVS
jgi:RNA polymerase sigma-70 factor (ECF subfamily)